jgi:hypothetical protein
MNRINKTFLTRTEPFAYVFAVVGFCSLSNYSADLLGVLSVSISVDQDDIDSVALERGSALEENLETRV